MIDDDAPTDPELAEQLDGLQAKMKESHRTFRRATLLGAGMLGLLAILDIVLVLATPSSVRLQTRDVTIVGGLATLGLVAYWGATKALERVVEADTSLLKELRRNAQIVTFTNSVMPLMRAIWDAHGRGVALVVPPPGVEDSPLPKPPPVIH